MSSIPIERFTVLIAQCAWCNDLKLGGGYLPTGMHENVNDIDLGGHHYQVSHGICEPCRERLMAEMHGERGHD